MQDATIWDYLQKNGDAEGNGGIYLVRLPSNLSTQIVAGDYICFNGDGELDVFVSPYGTIKFDCDNEREMKHELYKEYNFCLEPSQMTDLGNGYQQVTFTTTGDVTVTATYEIKQKTQVTVTKPNNVAFATINVTGHKKEMEWTTSASTIVGYPIGGDGFRFDGTRVHVGNTNGNGEVSYSDDYGVTWNTFNDIELKSGFRPGDLPNAIVFLRDYVDMYISYDNKHYIILPGQFSVASDHSSFNAGFKWSRNKDATVKYMQIFNSGRVAISNDGFNWTNSATLSLPESRCLFRNGVYHVNNKWYTLTAGAANLYLYTSVDGVNWEMITNPKGPSGDWGTGNLLGLAYGSNLMMAMGTGGRLVGTSRDFKTVKWRQSSVNLGLEVGGLRHICYANGNFIIGQGGTAIAYTTFHDGVMWRVNGSTKNQIGAASRDIDHSVSGTINTEENNSTVYSSNMTITDISVTYDKVVPLNPSTVVEYKKIRLPENSAYIDYSDSSRPVYIANADAFQNSLSHKNGWIYDSAKGFFVNRSNTGYYSDIDCIMSGDHTSLSYSDDPFSMYQYTLDGFMFVNDRPQNRYSTSGLSRTYTSFSSFMRTGLSWNDYMGTAGTISLIMQTLTLPINAALWAGADGSTLHSHHWQSNADGN